MDMAAKFQDQTVFHMTGKRAGDGLAALDSGFRPALLAAFRDLTRLRYDYPVVLLDGDSGPEYVQSLSSAIGELITELAPRGIEGERLRKQLLRLEREIRGLLATGSTGTLTELWPEAAAKAADTDDSVREVLTRAADALHVDGELLDCSRALSELRQRSRQRSAEKAAAVRTLADHLVRKLSDILRAAFVHSGAGQQPTALQSGFGSLHGDVFDFSAMSRLVARNVPKDQLPAKRRERIEWALSLLRNQPFYPDPRGAGSSAAPYEFVFDNCAAAIEAHRARLPQLVEVVKAIAIAELEARGGYVEVDHDPFFERYDEDALTADDLAQFPDYLVCIPADRNDAPENASLMEMLSAGMPSRCWCSSPTCWRKQPSGRTLRLGVRSARLATTAMASAGCSCCNQPVPPYALRDRVRCGMGCRGPAPFSVFSGSPEAASELPPYLTAGRGDEVAAFPAFLRRQRRLQLGNPVLVREQPESGGRLASRGVRVCGRRSAASSRKHPLHLCRLCCATSGMRTTFAVVPRERWTAAMVPVADWLVMPESEAADRVPFVLAVDQSDRLHRVIIDTRLMQATRRCMLLWHRLQEHGGIHNSHAGAGAGARTGGVGGPEAAGDRCAEAGSLRNSRRRDGEQGDRRGRAGCGRGGLCGSRTATVGPGVDRDQALLELQRVPEHQRQAVRLRREQTGLHQGHQRRHLQGSDRGGRGLSGGDHPPGQAEESRGARPGRAAGAREAFPLKQRRTRSNADQPATVAEFT
jgi:hypothetical protein